MDIERFVLERTPIPSESVDAFRKMGTIQQLAIYGNWMKRFPPLVSRTVRLSSVLRANPYFTAPNHSRDIATLIEKIDLGHDLHPHLSRRVTTAFDPNGPLKRTMRRDLDMLLNDWGVHHLHLSSEPDPKHSRFMKRTELVLLAAFTDTDAYLIDIVPHRRWSDDTIVQIIVREWPDAGLLHEVSNLPSERPISFEDRIVLREIGVQAFVAMDGAVYSGDGFSTSGISLDAMFSAMDVHRRLRWFADCIDADPEFMSNTLRKHGVEPPPKLDLHFEIDPGNRGWGVYDRVTQVFMFLPTFQ